MKKIILFLFVLISVANAEYYMIVDNPDQVKAFHKVIESSVKLLHSDGYYYLLKLAFLMGGFFTFLYAVAGAFRDGGKEGLYKLGTYWISGVAILSIVFSSSDTLVIKSKNFPQYYEDNVSSATMGVAIDNVPTVMAFTFHAFNVLQNEATDLYEIAFDVDTVRDNGYVADKTKDLMTLLSTRFEKGNVTLGSAIYTFTAQCIYIPFSAHFDGLQKIEEISKSTNIKQTIDNWYTNGDTVGGIKTSDFLATWQGEQWKCGDFWNYIKENKLAAFTDNDAKSFLSSLDSRDLQLITNSRDVPKSNFDEIVIQAGLVNSLINNKNLPVGISYGAGKQEVENLFNGLVNAEFFKGILTSLQSGLLALLYAFFPMIIVTTLIMGIGGLKVIKEYFNSLIWLSLWGITATIISSFMSDKVIEKLHEISNGDINAYTVFPLLSEAARQTSIAGYLYALVPAITWLILKGSAHMLEGLAGNLATNLHKNIGTESIAQDAKKLQMKESASAKTGQDLSYAEALHFQQISSGIREGTAIGIDMNQGKAAIAKLEDYNKSKAYKDLQKKEEFLKRIGHVGGVEDVVDTEATVGAASLTKSIGEFETAGVKGMHGAGRHAGRGDSAKAAIERKHGAALNSSLFNKENEDIIKTNVRMSTLKKELGDLDTVFKTSAKQDTMTQEVPNFLRNDRDGDGKVSDSEISFEQDVNTIEAKKGVVSKFAQQQQELINAEKNRRSGSVGVRRAMANAEKLMQGSDSRTAAIVGAAATKTTIGAMTENANQRKDARVIEQLRSQNRDMEDTSLLNSKRMIGDLAQTKTQTDTTGGLITDLVDKKSEIREAIGEKLDKNMSYGEREEAKDKILMHSMAKVGIADSELTHRNLSLDVSRVQNETQSKLRAGLEKVVGSENLQTLHAYETLQRNRENIAHRLSENNYSSAEERQRDQLALKQYDDVIIPQFEKSADMQQIMKRVEAYHNSSEAQSIIKEGEQKLNAIYSSYEREGLIRVDQNGHVQYADTVKTINSLKGEQKALYVEGVKRSLDGLKTSTVGIDGMQLERVDNVIGDHITERATATKEWSKNARFTHDIQYYAVENDWIKPENLAKVNTAVGATKDLLGLYGFARVVKR